jgi:Family of unknown function (DUF6288)/HEAT repeats
MKTLIIGGRRLRTQAAKPVKRTLLFLIAIAHLATPGPLLAAGKVKSIPNPDFTKGDAIPEGAKHDWNLGATGARGWLYSETFVTTDARQISITRVEKASPADGVLAVGDVILGAGGKPFSHDPRTEMGRALTFAESEAGNGNLSLIRWRGGKTEQVVVKLPVLGTYSATAPYHCPKSKRILEQGCKDLAARMEDPSYAKGMNPIPRSINALALLASGNPDYLPLIKKETEWGANFTSDAMATWYYGYIMMFLAEYKIATGDDSVMPGLRRLALEAAHGQSAVGSWGHKFARPDGRLFGYGMMNAPGVPLTSAMAMARMAGVKDPALDQAIERSAKLLRFYIGKGAIPYGDHTPWMQTHEDNGKCGMAAFMFNLLGESNGAEFFSRMSVASHGAERDGGHTGNFFNLLWAVPGVALSGPQATGAWMTEFGTWYFDLARGPKGNFVHQGPPEPGNDSYVKWDASGGYLLACAMPLRKIMLTGKKPSLAPQLDAAAAGALVRDGRGWDNKDRNSAYDKLGPDQLLECLGSWSPIVRDRAAMALGRRKGAQPVAALVKMLSSPRLEARYGACDALAALKETAAPAVPELVKLLNHEDLWMRVKAAEALSDMGAPAMATVPVLLERLAQKPAAGDPRGMEQRYLCFNVFGKMLKKSLDGVDQALLRNAVAAGLQNQDGRARGEIGGIYQKLSYEQIRPLLPAIRQSIIEAAPSGEMFAAGIRLAGLDILAKHRIRDGMDLCFTVMEIDQWGKARRVPQCLKTLGTYGAAAKPMLPRLRQLEKDMPANGMSNEVGQVTALIREIENATGTVELRSIN